MQLENSCIAGKSEKILAAEISTDGGLALFKEGTAPESSEHDYSELLTTGGGILIRICMSFMFVDLQRMLRLMKHLSTPLQLRVNQPANPKACSFILEVQQH